MKKAKWIWKHSDIDTADDYVKFYDSFSFSGENDGKVRLELSCDSNYELYLNGTPAAFGQYPDFPYDKVYDVVDLTPYCVNGKNSVCILVWYYGKGSMTYCKGLPGLIYEISSEAETEDGGRVLACSDSSTMCKAAGDYVCGRQKLITSQLGLSYTYDARGYDGYNRSVFPDSGLFSALEVEGRAGAEQMRSRPNKKIELLDFTPASLIDEKRRIYDLGRESVGYLSLRFRAPAGCVVNIAYGEYVAFPGDGEAELSFATGNGGFGVRRKIHNRDFSVEVIGNGEWFEFRNFMRRLGCRYFQVSCESAGAADLTDAVEIDYIGLYPAQYPVNVLEYKAENALRQRIYDTCVRTLRLCMFEHYEDCPWREQALYTLDSRNQMLCGYYAFGEYDFPRSVLKLIGSDRREDGLLHICAPSRDDLVIPFFSLIYIIETEEYVRYSGDTSVVSELYEKLCSIMQVFLDRVDRESGLVPNFYGDKRYWNFYEWNPTLSGKLFCEEEKAFDVVLNCTVSLALSALETLSGVITKAAGENKNPPNLCRYGEYKKAVNERINAVFFDEERGVYRTFADRDDVCELGNAMAVLCGAAAGETAVSICDKIVRGEIPVPTTLSMKAFKYDALLSVNEAYRAQILSEIDRVYGYMLNCGATSFWETINGARDFGSAGSLCHGWSAVPIIYMRGKKK